MAKWLRLELGSANRRFQSDEFEYGVAHISADQFVSSFATGDVASARRVLETVANMNQWKTFANLAVARIESAWNSDEIHLHSAAEAFCAIERFNVKNFRKTPYKFTSEQQVIVFTPELDQHTFGARLLREEFTSQGVDVELLTRARSSTLVNRLSEKRFDVLAISVSYDGGMLGLADLITSARIQSAQPRLQIIVGGQALSGQVNSFAFLGADSIVGPEQNTSDIINHSLKNARGVRRFA